jgi:hypothetical protein
MNLEKYDFVCVWMCGHVCAGACESGFICTCVERSFCGDQRSISGVLPRVQSTLFFQIANLKLYERYQSRVFLHLVPSDEKHLAR